MTRKRWTRNTQNTPEIKEFREKKKWQIALRRYVLEQSPAVLYAPYFGLDAKNIREWFESQFKNDISWEDFGKKWQFDHVIPITYFDFTNEEELKMCWNFTNLSIELFQENKNRGDSIDILGAKKYFKELYDQTGYKPCLQLFEKIESLELSEFSNTSAQQAFMKFNKNYLEEIANYSTFEFELLNKGRSPDEIRKEIDPFAFGLPNKPEI